MEKQNYPAWVSLDNYIATRIVEAIDCWLPQICSYPSDMSLEEWKGILLEIREGFMAALKMINYEWDTDEEYLGLKAVHDRGMELFVKHFFELWD